MEDGFEDPIYLSSDEDQTDLITESKTLDGIEPPHEEHLSVLHKIFGHKEFRPMQWKIISSIINDRRDNCAIMATGYGKSLCYQFPAVYCGGVTIVISPLISLMEDQVLSLTITNIPACLLGSAQTQQRKVIEEILDNKYSIVYLTPEFCCGDYGRNLLRELDGKLTISLVAIDEAHCISAWGHDFRHKYKELSIIKKVIPHVPILAVTATATKHVRQEIVSLLKLRNPQVICSGFNRPNLYFSAHLKGEAGIIADLRKVMIRQDGDWIFPGPTIVYCITRKDTETVANILRVNGIKCVPYHSGMSVKQRKENHENFVRDKVPVIVATIAFGMGIDKPDIRNIVHYGACMSIENYYQEVGRAGRDGQPAKCTIFYKNADYEMLRTIREHSYTTEATRQQKEAMTELFSKYLDTSGCRRLFILQHFEGAVQKNLHPTPNCCDNCTKRLSQTEPEEYEEVNANGLMDIAEYAHTMLASIKVIGENRGLQSYILFLRGSKSSKVSDKLQNHALHGSGKHKNELWWKCIARILVQEKYIQKETIKQPTFSYCTVVFTEKGKKFLESVVGAKEKISILIDPPPDLRALLKKKRVYTTPIQPPTISTSTFDSDQWILKKKVIHNNTESEPVSIESELQIEQRMKIYKELMKKRNHLAAALECSAYMIVSNEILMNLSQLKPQTLDQLRQCKLNGFTEAKINKFGQQFINVIHQMCPNERRSIQAILGDHPMENVKFTPTVETTYTMYSNGISTSNIAKERGITEGTVFEHLINCMKLGYPIKLKTFNVSKDIKNTVADIISNLPPLGITLTSIKNLCPPEFTFTQIKAVKVYLEIREHLKFFCSEYEEFHDDSDLASAAENIQREAVDEEFKNGENSTCHKEETNKQFNIEQEFQMDPHNDDDVLSAFVNEIDKGGYLNYDSDDGEPPLKKLKSKISLVDTSP